MCSVKRDSMIILKKIKVIAEKICIYYEKQFSGILGNLAFKSEYF